MKTIFERSSDLFKGVLLEDTFRHPTFTHLKSVFSDPWYNFIVPHTTPRDLNWQEIDQVIEEEKTRGYTLTYYIRENLLSEFKEYFASHGNNQEVGSECYMFKHTQKETPTLGEFALVTDDTLNQYINIAKSCFPGWDNSDQYSRLVYQYQTTNQPTESANFFLKVNDDLIGVGGVLYSKEANLAYFHNVGILEEYRRQGYFTAITHHSINFALSKGITDSYALMEFEEPSYKGYKKMGYELKDKYHIFEI